MTDAAGVLVSVASLALQCTRDAGREFYNRINVGDTLTRCLPLFAIVIASQNEVDDKEQFETFRALFASCYSQLDEILVSVSSKVDTDFAGPLVPKFEMAKERIDRLCADICIFIDLGGKLAAKPTELKELWTEASQLVKLACQRREEKKSALVETLCTAPYVVALVQEFVVCAQKASIASDGLSQAILECFQRFLPEVVLASTTPIKSREGFVALFHYRRHVDYLGVLVVKFESGKWTAKAVQVFYMLKTSQFLHLGPAIYHDTQEVWDAFVKFEKGHRKAEIEKTYGVKLSSDKMDAQSPEMQPSKNTYNQEKKKDTKKEKKNKKNKK